MFKKVGLFLLLGIVAIGLSGCPALNPPFDTTGKYTGTFTLGAGTVQLADHCSIKLELAQDFEGLPLNNAKVTGKVNLSLACVAGGTANASSGPSIQDLLDGILGQVLGVAPIDLGGAILPNGTIELNTEGLLSECTDNSCEKLVLLGSGTDTDGDNQMDSYSGTIGGIVQVSGQLVPLVGQFSVTADSAS